MLIQMIILGKELEITRKPYDDDEVLELGSENATTLKRPLWTVSFSLLPRFV